MTDKIKLYKPKTIEEAIDNLQTFLEADLWHCFDGEKFPDRFKKEEDLWKYLEVHFNMLIKEIRAVQRGKK